jgi:dipeptidyl aminopeptidase/acylaminoacyl peptidase
MADRAWQWTPERRVGYPAILEVAPSPDGRRIAYVVREPLTTDERSEMISHIYLAEADADREPVQLTFGDQRDWHPRWSPDGRYLAFLSKRSEKANVHALRVDGGEAFAVTKSDKGDVGTFAWSPDGGRLAVAMTEPPGEEKEKRRKAKDDAVQFEVDVELQQLYVVPFAPGARKPSEPRQLTRERQQVLSCEWLPDGKTVAYTRMPTPTFESWPETTLALVPSDRGGEPRQLAAAAAPNPRVFPSPDGRWVACLAHPPPVRWSFTMRVCLVPVDGGEARWLAPAPDETGELIGWSPDGRELYLVEPEGTTSAVWALPASGEPPRPLARGDLARVCPAASRNGRIAYAGAGLHEPNAVYLLDERGERLVARPPLPPEWPDAPLPGAEAIRWNAPDGREIEGIVVYPLGHQPGRRYPLIVEVHGGPAGVFQRSYLGGLGGYADAAALAERGYALLRPNPRGSSGYGREFRLANVGDWAGGDFADVMAGVDHLIARGLADPERLGILGWSYGGFMTGMAITLTDRFKAACFGAGLSNPVSFTGTADIQSFIPDYFGGELWDAPEAYARCSAVLNASKVRTPTLIQHGEADKRVPVGQGYELYYALKRRGVPVEMVVYPREGHGVEEPRHAVDVRQRTIAWFERWLPADP